MERTLGTQGKDVAVLVHNYYEQAEFDDPIAALRRAGATVTVLGADTQDLQALQHVQLGTKTKADLLLSDARTHDYDALILPGGVFNADHLRMVERARSWVVDFLDNDKLVAAICHAPWLLVSADVIEERRITSYYTLQDDIRNAGGEWIDLPVVIDDNLITSRKPDDLPLFNEAILAWLVQH